MSRNAGMVPSGADMTPMQLPAGNRGEFCSLGQSRPVNVAMPRGSRLWPSRHSCGDSAKP